MSQNLSEQSKSIFLVVDENEAIVAETSQALKGKYPQVEILTALDAQTAQSLAEKYYLDLVMLDLNLPYKQYCTANYIVGIQLLKTLMQANYAPTIAVSSINIKSLMLVRLLINNYKSSFVAMHKCLSTKEMLKLVDFALKDTVILAPEKLPFQQFDLKWIEMLRLKFEQGLTERAIARRIGVSDRTLRTYWKKIQDFLGIYDEPEKDFKIQIQIAAREIGLIG